MVTLRDYQQKIINGVRKQLLAGKRRVILQASTGAGKTLMASYMLASSANRGKRVLFIVHRDYLMSQSSDTFRKIGLAHGLIAPQYKPAPQFNAQIASVQTLIRRIDEIQEPNLIVIDEAHRTMGNTYRKILEHWPNAFVVGLTATPQRLDRKPLGDVYGAIVDGPEMRWLIDHGFLSNYRAFIPPQKFDMKGVKSKFGDYDPTEASERVNTRTVTGDAIEHYRRLLDGKRAVVFCTSLDHSRAVTTSFNDAGIRAEHVDGNTDFHERKRIIARFESGETKILCNVDLVSEGFDLPAVEGVIMLRPTQSLVKYIQSVGRALRPSAGKTHAIILDHVGNIATHGMPDEEREWSLDAPKKKKNAVGAQITKTCPECYAVHIPSARCPECGHVYETKGRQIVHVDGDLKEVSASEMQELRSKRKMLMGEAKTYEDLQALGKRLGYRPGWSWHVWQERQKHKS